MTQQGILGIAALADRLIAASAATIGDVSHADDVTMITRRADGAGQRQLSSGTVAGWPVASAEVRDP